MKPQATADFFFPFPFFSFSAIGLRTTACPATAGIFVPPPKPDGEGGSSNTSITCSTPGSSVPAMIWSHAARALWRRRAAHLIEELFLDQALHGACTDPAEAGQDLRIEAHGSDTA